MSHVDHYNSWNRKQSDDMLVDAPSLLEPSGGGSCNFEDQDHCCMLFAGDANEIYVEVVQGLGETLVGNLPGSAFSFVAQKDRLPANSEDPASLPAASLSDCGITITSYPSKSVAMHVPESGRPNFIFRSDSNGEDLEGCAHLALYLAGLSIP